MANSPSPGRGRPVNEQARSERMHQILEGARACFIERGFHASSISEITAAAKVSTANMYQYYPTKDALIIALIEEDLRRHLGMLSRFTATDFRFESLKATFDDLFTTKEGHKIAVIRAEIASEGSRNQTVAQMLRDTEAKLVASALEGIKAAQKAGRAPDTLDPEEALERVSLTFEGIMRLYVFSPEEGESLLNRLCLQITKTFYPID